MNGRLCDRTATAGGWRRRPFTLAGVAVALLLAGCASLAAQLQQQHQAQVAFDEGVQRYDARDYAGALPSLARALTLLPTSNEVETYLAWSHYHLAKYPEAALHFRQVITRQPNWEGLHDGLGWTRYREGRYHIALQAFQQALDLAPAYRDAAIGFAFSLFELGRYHDTRPRLEQLIRDGRATAFRNPAPDLEGSGAATRGRSSTWESTRRRARNSPAASPSIPSGTGSTMGGGGPAPAR